MERKRKAREEMEKGRRGRMKGGRERMTVC